MCMLVGLMVWSHKAAKQKSVCVCVCVYVCTWLLVVSECVEADSF